MSSTRVAGAPADAGGAPPGPSGRKRLRAALAGRRGDLVAFFAGAPLPLAFAPFGLHPLAPLGLALLLLCLDGVGPRRAALRGFLFGIAGFLAGTYWLYISLHEFGEAPLFVAIPLMLGLVMVMATYFALAAWLLVRLFPRAGTSRWLLGVPGIWVLVEWLRSWFATGFPWFAYGYSQLDTPLVGFAPVLGVFGVGLAVAAVAGALCLAVSGGQRARIGALALVVALHLAGAGLQAVTWSAPLGDAVDVAVVQGGISQDLKWQAEQLPKTKALYRRLTLEHLDADLVVWPEAAIPALLRNYRNYLGEILLRAKASNTRLLLGTLQAKGTRPERRIYNSVVGFDGARLREYHKYHLVPFGEYYPVPAFVRRWMKTLDLPYTDIAAGPRGQGALELDGLAVGVSICYEDVFGAELLGALPAAGLLVNVSNDAWFGGSVAPHQHLQIARMRAVEVARPMVRATNSGISAVIEHDGRLRSTTGLFEAVVLRAVVQPRQGATPYARIGDLPVVLLALALTLGGILTARRR